MAMVVPGGEGQPLAAYGGSAKSVANPNNPVDQGFIGWEDLFLPGSNILNKIFDTKGTEAAKRQFQMQMFLDNSAREFNANEAQKQRAFEEYMSNTQYQRLAADLKAAGLNPWLAVNGGQASANVPSGSSASSSSGSASMANNKIAVAAGLIATALRMFLAKH